MSYRPVLANRTSRGLVLAHALSDLGDAVGLAALLVLVHQATGSVWGPALVYAVKSLPALAVSTIGSGWLDVPQRKHAAVSLAAFTALLVMVVAVHPTTAVALVVAGLLGAVHTATAATSAGMVAESVPEQLTQPTVAVISGANQASQVLGLAAGGAVALALTPSSALWAHAALLVVAAVVLLRTPLVAGSRERRAPASPLVGVRLILGNPRLRVVATGAWLMMVLSAVPETLAPVIVGPALLPLALASNPIGGTIGAILAGRTRGLERPRLQLWWYLTGGLSMVVGGALWVGGFPAAIIATNVALGVATGALIGAQVTFLREVAPARMAQVSATMVGALIVLEGVGALLIGALVTLFGPGVGYAVLGGGLAAGCALLLLAKGARTQTANDPLPS